MLLHCFPGNVSERVCPPFQAHWSSDQLRVASKGMGYRSHPGGLATAWSASLTWSFFQLQHRVETGMGEGRSSFTSSAARSPQS